MKPKKLKVLIWLLCVPVVLAFVLYLPTMIHGDDPFNMEHALCEDFVRTNSVVRSLFGDSLKVTSNNYGGSCGNVSIHSGTNAGPQGWFRYDVMGSKSNGTIVVNWQGKGRKNFEVLSIESFINGETKGMLWKQE